MKIIYYVINEDKRILAINDKKESLLRLYEKEDIKESNEEIIEFNGEYRFVEDIKEEYINELKENKIKEIDIFIKDKVKEEIKKDYNFDLNFNEPITLNRLLEVRKTLNKNINEIFNIIENIYTKYSTLKEELTDKINKMKSVNRIKKIDIEEKFKEKELKEEKEAETIINIREELTK